MAGIMRVVAGWIAWKILQRNCALLLFAYLSDYACLTLSHVRKAFLMKENYFNETRQNTLAENIGKASVTFKPPEHIAGKHNSYYPQQ